LSYSPPKKHEYFNGWDLSFVTLISPCFVWI
jgi:hypothetical protein